MNDLHPRRQEWYSEGRDEDERGKAHGPVRRRGRRGSGRGGGGGFTAVAADGGRRRRWVGEDELYVPDVLETEHAARGQDESIARVIHGLRLTSNPRYSF